MPPIPHERPCCPSAPGTRPLPDPAAVRLCLIPDSAPPYDAELTRGGSASPAGLTGLLPASGARTAGPPPSAAPGQPAAPGHLRAGAPSLPGRSQPSLPGRSQPSLPGRSQPGLPERSQPGLPERSQAGAPRRSRAPEPGWPSRFAQILAETLAGSRPARQLVPWTTERARDHIQRLGPHLTSSQRPRVRRVVTSCPAADVMEMSVVVGYGARVRALAVRLERASPSTAQASPADGPRWLCTAVEAA
jgi:Family of unknown function (DUF6459)